MEKGFAEAEPMQAFANAFEVLNTRQEAWRLKGCEQLALYLRLFQLYATRKMLAFSLEISNTKAQQEK